ncbi:putative PEP-binding protein [Leptodesmis sichuanensis]|uniref:putative PEP-binding protein n=1 Tax=Leptodesmis sichuanensis TaxID=2906798 RepID=UPI001F2F9D63|nr:putative PEP-binding protein [Leptodesmis sichuanensis]UIE40076.1 hypothetical protein KIK02_11330 [Leptodesmis sichuanensis A121]
MPSVTSVGYKAFHLSQLLQKGYPVLPGFVVTAEVLWSFLHSIAWEQPLFADFPSSALRVDIDNPAQLQAIATQLRHSITTSPLPNSLLQELEIRMAELPATGLILRPSLLVNHISQSTLADHVGLATGSGGGLFNAEICAANLPSLAKALLVVWANLFSAKSLFYWQRSEIPLQNVRLAVLVQSMQDAIAAGTAMTTPSQVQIQATSGLGMAIDRGEVVPDTYQIQLETGTVQAKHLGWKAIAYHLAAPLAESTSLLTAVPLSDEEQQRHTLQAIDLEQLVDLVQQVMADFGANLSLGWLLYQQANGTRQLYLTHVLPTGDHRETRVSGQNNRSSRVVSSPPSRQAPYKRTANQQILIGTGLAASGGQVFARASVIASDRIPADISPHTVLVAPTIPLDWLPWIETAAALVTEQGSMTSHCAILARELRVPAVLGVPNVTQQIQSGELLWVDGDRGRIYRITKPTQNPVHSPLPTLSERTVHLEMALSLQQPLPQTVSRSPRRTQLMVNLSQPTRLEQIAALPVDGVGLLRSELLALSVLDAQSPDHWLQRHSQQEFIQQMAAAIQQFAQAFHPRPVFYRSLDLRPHEWHGAADQMPHSEASVLGLRGAFSYQLAPELFQLELAAIAQVQQAGYANVRLILPFVRAVEEFTVCRQYVEQAGLLQAPEFQLWIMAEVPAVLLLLPEFVEAGVQGISIGTNDLTQLLLGAHRDQPELASVFNERHPAVQRAIAYLIQQSRQLKIPCAICGEAPSRSPDLIKDLVEWGIDAISVVPDAVERTQAAIVQAEARVHYCL